MNLSRRHPTFSILMLAALAGSLTACGSGRPILTTPSGNLPSGFPEHTVPMIRTALAAAADSLESYEASGNVALQTPDERKTYKIHLRQRTNDSLLVDLSPGLGIIAARGLATHDSVFVHDRFHHRLYYGALRYVARVLPELASLSALFENLTGTFVPPEEKSWSVTADSAHYILSAHEEMRQYRITVDPRLWRVIRYEVRSRQGTLLEERRFSNFQGVNGIYMPSAITVRRPPQDTRLRITYDSLHPNPKQLAFSFTIAPGVERIPITEEVE
jgi:outer membrane lipoprotein-sorting protein